MKTYSVTFYRFFSQPQTVEIIAASSDLAIAELKRAFGTLDRVLDVQVKP